MSIAVGCLFVVFSGGVTAEPFVDLDPDTDLDGDGTATNPYEISNASELQAMGGNLSANYTLVGTIEAANTSAWNGGAGFVPIGNDTHRFTGTFDGNEKMIRDLAINRTTDSPVGLFGAADGAVIERVGLDDVDIVGNASAGGTIFVGGLVGNLSGTITNSSVTGSVTGSDTAGGLVGNLNGTVTDSSANSSVDGGSRVGGLIGFNADGEIETSYAVGEVDGSNSATDPGGLVGNNTGTVKNSYWDTVSTDQDASDGGSGLTKDQMTGHDATANMDGFEFYDHWIPTNEDYPVLTWEFFAESTGDGTEQNPYRVGDSYGLQAIDADLTANYTLSGTIDMSETAAWNDGAGFEPIANGSSFSGSIDGEGNTISDLPINRSSTESVGLVSFTGDTSTISNLTVTNATISGHRSVGTIVGTNSGTVSGVHVSTT
ncbi:MAG: hypothetical protein R6V31_01695, partial [Halohasta sp.]